MTLFQSICINGFKVFKQKLSLSLSKHIYSNTSIFNWRYSEFLIEPGGIYNWLHSIHVNNAKWNWIGIFNFRNITECYVPPQINIQIHTHTPPATIYYSLIIWTIFQNDFPWNVIWFRILWNLSHIQLFVWYDFNVWKFSMSNANLLLI